VPRQEAYPRTRVSQRANEQLLVDVRFRKVQAGCERDLQVSEQSETHVRGAIGVPPTTPIDQPPRLLPSRTKMRKARVRTNGGPLSWLSVAKAARVSHFFVGSAGVEGVEGVEPVDGVDGVPFEAGSDVVVLVVDGSDAGLLSLPPQAASIAMADRTSNFFI